MVHMHGMAKYFHYMECCVLEGRNGKKRKEKGVGDGRGRETLRRIGGGSRPTGES